MKVSELSKVYREKLPQINEEEIRIMWHCRYYDGPRDGVLLYKDTPCWFKMVARDDDIRLRVDNDGEKWNDWYARFIVIELTDEQFNEERYWNELFREKVGTHWDYNERGKRIKGKMKPEEFHKEFYDASEKRKPRDFSDNVVLGWFERLWATAEVE